MHHKNGVSGTQGGKGSDKKVRKAGIALLAGVVLLTLGILLRPVGRGGSILPRLTGTGGHEHPEASQQQAGRRSPSHPGDSGVATDNRMMLRADATPPNAELDVEAAHQAVQFFYPMITGESNDVHSIRKYRDPMRPDKERTVYDLRNFNVEINPSEVTETEIRDGIEWQGYARLMAGPARSYVLPHLPSLGFMKETDLSATGPDTAWSPGTDRSIFGVTLVKANGKWSIRLVPVPDPVWDRGVSPDQVNSSEIPDYPP